MDAPQITSDPTILKGKPFVAGTQITVEHILRKLGAGESIDQLLDSHSQLTREAILVALRFAAEALGPRLPDPSRSGRHVIPDEWKPRLRAHLLATRGEDRDRLSAADFRGDQAVHLLFADGSFVLFQSAFALLDESGKQCLVFTEHCGYHVFPVGARGIQVLRVVRPDQNLDSESDSGKPAP